MVNDVLACKGVVLGAHIGEEGVSLSRGLPSAAESFDHYILVRCSNSVFPLRKQAQRIGNLFVVKQLVSS